MKLEHIIVATDFSDQAEVARDHALQIAARTGARITILHVFDESGFWPDVDRLHQDVDVDYEMFVRAEAEARQARVANMCEPASPELHISARVERGQPASRICEVAVKERADLIVVGSHGHTGFRRLLLGSVAERVVRQGCCSVLLARGPKHAGVYRKILVPTDFSETAERALQAALMLVAGGGTIDVLHLWQTSFAATGFYASWERTQVQREQRERAVRRRCDELIDRYRTRRPKLESIQCLVAERPPIQGILEQAERADYDLVAVGSHGTRGLRRWLIGSVAENTVRHAPCSVLVVHDQPA